MKTIAHQIHAAKYQQMKAIVTAIEQNDLAMAKSLAESAIRSLPPSITTSEDIQALFFFNAVAHRLDDSAVEAGNLYLMPDQGQQIKMFNFMAEKFPIVRFSQDMVNAAHLAHMQNQSDIVLLDIGIGSGQQMARLLSQATSKKITVIGVEPAQESLKNAEIALQKAAENQNISLQFIGISKTLESLTPQDWQQLDNIFSARNGNLLINASFALHHIHPTHFRSELFTSLRRYQPAFFAIIEPYADFLTTDFSARFDNAWHHYGLTFGAIDQIEATLEEKSLLKKIFFSREIQDVLAEEGQRIEQFETGEMWLNRLTAAGLQSYRLPNIELNIPGCPFVTVHQDGAHVSLNVQGHPLVSIVTVCSA
jgi:hypothetical protein